MTRFTDFLVDLLNVGWSDLVDLGRSALGGELVSVLIDIFGEIADVSENGIGGWIQSKVQQAMEFISGLAGDVKSIAMSAFRLLYHQPRFSIANLREVDKGR